ncbi:S-layer homology domain-containing protein [uncultured Paenibacillus sp.]|uniref:S-layer homology domain-containing protein n=1 Tax=uncultured Paenibacillus sp. TaxID=227322 RepID=UPI0015AF6083|nr:S-layer homology domain-containing protein [uncultured Paenibacillus sp.]
MKRIFAWFMVLSLALGVLPMTVFADSEGTAVAGSGTAGDPFIVTTLDQLDAVRDNLTAHYRLGADIDASATAGWDGGAGWMPIGERGGGSSTQFTGVFDGAGHVIRNLTINRPSQDGVGLFGMIGTGGVVRSLGIEGGTITGGNYTGALAGNNNGTIEQSHTGVDVRGYGLVGGLAGYEYGQILASYATGDVSGTNNVGGLIGRSDGTVTEAYATGHVEGNDTVGGLIGLKEGGELSRSYFAGTVHANGQYIGGLVGFLFGAILSQSYNIGSVSGDHIVGGLVGITDYGYIGKSYASGQVTAAAGDVGGVLGSNNGTVMESNYWDAETSGLADGCGHNNDAYGVPCVAVSLTTAEALSQAGYAGLDFAADWFMLEGSTRPFLRAEWSQDIGNAHQLQLMAMDLTAAYSLTGDMDFGTVFTDDSRGDMWATSAGAGAGFAPIGDATLGPFTGQLDGQGHAVRGLIINRPGTGQVGLIGHLGDGGFVHGVGVEGGRISGGYSSGGLIGDNRGGTVELSYSTASVSGTDNVGGLVGNMFPGMITNSFAGGDVSGSIAVGGLVGRADLGSLVEDAYATGSVVGSSESGGLIGRHVGTVNRAYAAGEVQGSGSEIGGLVGREFSPTSIVTSGYYDAATSGHGGGKPTAAMKRKSTFETWDWDGTWTIEEGRTYPALQGIAANLGIDTAPPAIVNLRIQDPNRLRVTFDEEVNLLATGGFSVLADGVDIGVVDLVKTGAKTLELTVGEELRGGQDVRLSYDSQAGSVSDLANHPLLSVADQPWPPELTITMAASTGEEYQDATWTNQPVTVSASVYGASADVTEFVYSLDGGDTWTAYASSFELRDDGVHVLDFKAVDQAGMETTARRTVKISAGGLTLTPEMIQGDGSPYGDGDWTNQTVTISVYAVAGFGEIVSFTYTVDGESPQAYANGTPLEITGDGDHRVLFQAEDEAGHRLSEELKVRIDRTPPAVDFSPNGREFADGSASSRTTVGDAGSGVDASTLQYAWTTDPSAPTGGWIPFVNGANLTKSGSDGDWYLHVRAADQAGNEMTAASLRFRLVQRSSNPAPLPGNTSSSSGTPTLPNNVYPIGPAGGSAKFGGGEIRFPAGAMDRPFQVTIEEITDTSTLPLSNRERLVSRVFEFKKDVPGNFRVPVTVQLRLNADVKREDGSPILLVWLNKETGQWVALDDLHVDYENGTVSGTIDHFTKFAALSRAVEIQEPMIALPDIQGHYAEETIRDLTKSGIVSGYPDGTFRPNRPITRAEFVSILSSILPWEPAAEKTFADTEKHWARSAISIAYANGIVQGVDDHRFAPDQPITREQMAVMAANALHLEKPKAGLSFADGERISSWAKDAIEAVTERGIFSGYPDRTIRPQAQATRAEAVMVIDRIMKMYAISKTSDL